MGKNQQHFCVLGISVWQNIANKLLEISIENESLRSIELDVSKNQGRSS